MKTGIYKITNPKNKIYIGQTIDFDRRIGEYKQIQCKNQKKLYASLKKYGVENHKFELIEECEFDDLNNRERYWQDYYNVIEIGLNLILVKSELNKTVVSEETKKKISDSLKEYFDNLSLIEKGKIYGKSSEKRKGCVGNRSGSKLSKEHIERVIESRKWYKPSEETKDKIRQKMIGRNITWGDKISKSNKGRDGRKNLPHKEIIQYDVNDNFIRNWNSITEASKETSIGFNTISNNLTGRTKVGGGFKWKYKNEKN